jgi:hypothetical protein
MWADRNPKTRKGKILRSNLDKLNEVSEWILLHKKMWESKFDSLENYINAVQPNKDTREDSTTD